MPSELCARVLDMVGARAGAHVTASAGRSSLTRFANSFIHQNVSEDRTSVSLTVVVDGRIASAGTTVVDDDGLTRLVDSTLDAARLRPVDPEWPGLAPEAEVTPTDHYDVATAEASPADRADVVRAFVDAAGGLSAAGFCATSDRDYAYANTAGQRAEDRATTAALEGIQQLVPGVSAGLATAASSRLADIEGAAAGSHAARTARAATDPVDLEPGDYAVVLQPECIATMIVFLAWDGFNAKSQQQGESCIRIGEAQFDRAITIVDDALDPRALGIGYDFEGTPKRPVDLVRNGVSVGLAHDRRTGRHAGTASTGHAVAGSDVWGPVPTDVFVTGGDTSVEELVAGVERGLLVSELNYCRVLDPKTMVLTGITRNGTFLIENGSVIKPVQNLRFTQSFLDALAPGNVGGLGRARFAASNEGPAFHVPAIRLNHWHFTGGAKG